METWEMMMRRRAREAKQAKLKSIVGRIVGSTVLAALVLGFCWICCAASGYHWEY